MSSAPIYIELSDRLRQRLANKKVDLQAELRQSGFHTELRGLSLAGRPQMRDPYIAILSAGITAALVGGAISRIIAAVSGLKHSQITERELCVAVDGNGLAIIDKRGDPVYNLTERPSDLPPPEVSTTKLVAGKLLSFDMSTGAKQSGSEKNKMKAKVSKKLAGKTAQQPSPQKTARKSKEK